MLAFLFFLSCDALNFFFFFNPDNPCPTQGDILSIRLSENEEILQQPEGSKKVIVETFFQMNYATGEWKRVRKVH